MTYYKLLNLNHTFLYIIFVTFGFYVNENIAMRTHMVVEGTDTHIYYDDYYYKPKSCLLYGPDDKKYTEFEPDTKYGTYCGFLVRDIDISQSGKWSISFYDTRESIDIQVIETPVKVSVNGAAVPTTETQLKSNRAKKKYFATYYYYEGDKVDVSCVSIAASNVLKKHYVTLRYSYAETLQSVFKNETLLSFSEVGLRTTLQAAHNNSFVLCKSAHVESHRTTYKTVNVTFLLQNTLSAKPITVDNQNQKATGLTNTITIQFGTSSNWKDPIPLQLNLPENKSFINMYAVGTDHLIYYAYEEGERLSVNCSTSLETMNSYQYYINFSGKVSHSVPFITLDRPLSSADNNTIIECFLSKTIKKKYSINEANIIRKINLVLWMNSPRKVMAITTEDSGRKNDSNWIIYLAAGVVICLLICCSIIIYKVKRRNCDGQRKSQLTSSPNRGSTLSKVETSNYELHYSVPNNQTVNPSYNQYVNASFQTDITYADLDLFTPKEVSNKVDNESANYAEIYHYGR